jgi:hypothetical protein
MGMCGKPSKAACYNFLTILPTQHLCFDANPREKLHGGARKFIGSFWRIHAKDRGCLLCGVTLHQPGRESGGGIAERVRTRH